jgi:hypothetical protein
LDGQGFLLAYNFCFFLFGHVLPHSFHLIYCVTGGIIYVEKTFCGGFGLPDAAGLRGLRRGETQAPDRAVPVRAARYDPQRPYP